MASPRQSSYAAKPGAKRALWRLLTGRSPERATATKLYGSIVTQARRPQLYERSGVADSPSGRLEMLLLHMALALWRLQREGETGFALARALNEVFVADMDDCMREMGVGDLAVPGKVRKAAAALYDRTRMTGEVLRAGDVAALEQALGSRMFQGGAAAARWLARYVLDCRDDLARQSAADLCSGTIRFAGPEQ